ncbi:MAG: hypothetical protein M3Y87_05800 [Myxococcota bacterium]|nr:hypothetical protein [Myxococcota bacterium]
MRDPSTSSTTGWRRTSIALSLAILAGCSEPLPADEIEAPGQAEEALAIAVTRNAIAYDFAQRDNLPHGVAGDERFVFTAEPLNGRVVALDRFTGREVGVLPPPARGWLLPFAMHITPEGTLVVLDPGGFPAPGVLTEPELHEYAYSWNRRTRRLDATLVRTISLAGYPIVFPEDFEITDEGLWVISEAGIGALWVITPEGSVQPGVFPAGFAPADMIPALSGCPFPDGVVVDDVPLQLAGGFAPGVGSLESRDGQLYFGNTCTGGLWGIPIASLTDARAPHERAADIVRVVERPEGVLAEALKGLNFREGEDWLYALDPFQLQVIRIDVETGEREVVLRDDVLLNFPISSTFLPPVLGISPLVVVSDEEHRMAALNVAIPEDIFERPFLITKLYVRRER